MAKRFEERKAAAEIYRTSLTNPDTAQRKLMMDFLVSQNLVGKGKAPIPADQIPRWLDATSQEIKGK